MKKQRHFPDKPQNKYGGNYQCNCFDISFDGNEWCHDEGNSGWNQFITWQKNDAKKLLCKGNRRTCLKLKYQWLASLSDKERKKY